MSEVKKCPECGGEMEKGFVNTSSWVFWDTKEHKRGIFGRPGGEVIIPLSLFTVRNVEADRCPKCRLILFKYGKKTELPQTMPWE
jgi:Zn-finger nucleic acid-binding protein